MGSKSSRVRIALFLAAVLFEFGFLDVKKFTVNADDSDEEPKDEETNEKGPEEEGRDSDKPEDTDPKKDGSEESDKDGDADDKMDAEGSEESELKGDCTGPYYRENCSEEKPCCLYDDGSYTCQAVKSEGENCTQNANAYNSGDCYCKQGLFCVNNKCSKDKP